MEMRLLLFVSLITSMSTTFSSDAGAHARWFLVNDAAPPVPIVLFDRTYGVLIAFVLFLLVCTLILDRLAARSPSLQRLISRPVSFPYMLEWRLLSVAFGGLLIASSMMQFFVAPDLPLGSGSTASLIGFVQILVGAMYVLQTRLLAASLATILLPFGCWALHSFSHAIDYGFELVGIGVALFLAAPSLSALDRSLALRSWRTMKHGIDATLQTPAGRVRLGWQPPQASWLAQRYERLARASSVLRVMLGLQLMCLAAHDKLLHPGISLAFVEKYRFVNFVAWSGFEDFTNLHFVIGAGMCEVLLGVLLVCGFVPRLVSGALLAIFTLTGLIFGIRELSGHLPIMAALLVVALAGSPFRQTDEYNRSFSVPSVLTTAGVAAALIGATFWVNLPIAPLPFPALASSVPEALYRRFESTAPQQRTKLRELTRAQSAVQQALSDFRLGRAVDKDDLARRMFELSVRYEAENGRDAASLWLRYAHLTAACSHDDIQAFRSLVAGTSWSDVLNDAPGELVAELTPIAKRSAEAIIKRPVDEVGPSFWLVAALSAPMSGPEYVHTHTLASIARILEGAAAEHGNRVVVRNGDSRRQ